LGPDAFDGGNFGALPLIVPLFPGPFATCLVTPVGTGLLGAAGVPFDPTAPGPFVTCFVAPVATGLLEAPAVPFDPTTPGPLNAPGLLVAAIPGFP